MKAVYVDIHIHTSENPNSINLEYDDALLLKNVLQISSGSPVLLSLTDHNTINKEVYLRIEKKDNVNILLGVELHIRKFQNAAPYHCHIIFNTPINGENIDKINMILDVLYPNKVVDDSMEYIPNIEQISNAFDDYDFLLLPHGGQSHRTFNKSLEAGKRFDTTLERSIYYNQFDGFTARSNKGLEESIEYFKRLGIHEFTNLITCSDNYDPSKYPQAKAADAEPFIPTWMKATPTFEGLRLSLSESTRLFFGGKPSEQWLQSIGRVFLQNEKVDIDVNMQQGLNVVIGGSSSGKTLFVDLIYRNLANNFEDCKYSDFSVQNASIINPSGTIPHYINQNFIISILQNEDKDINDIPLIARVFPEDETTTNSIRENLEQLKLQLQSLVDSVKKIEEYQGSLSKIPLPSRLLISGEVKKNIFTSICPSISEKSSLSLAQVNYDKYNKDLLDIKLLLNNNPLANNFDNEIDSVIIELTRIFKISNFSAELSNIIDSHKNRFAAKLLSDNQENQGKQKERDKLVQLVGMYFAEQRNFEEKLGVLSSYNVSYRTKEIVVQGHKLSIENSFKLTQQTLLEAINEFLKTTSKIVSFTNITSESLFSSNFKAQMPKVTGYENFIERVYSRINSLNKKKYKVITSSGLDFENLSPGWKSAIILDLVLGYNDDVAPIIIDQPEDNLATNYINSDLIQIIKDIKSKKQIILVSHNATIPMLGDAQNVVVCQNEGGQIIIRSAPLEGKLDSKSIVDFIAEITDGGKSSIKKRVKKYNLKSYIEERK